jgi:nucleoid DNA-binding protein
VAKSDKKSAKSSKSEKPAKVKGTTYNLTDFAKVIAEDREGTNFAEVKGVLSEFCKTISSTVTDGNLEPGDRINLPGIGIVHCVQKNARKARNPATGETLQVAARPGIKFRLAPAIRLWGKPVKPAKVPAKAAKKAKK